MGPQPVGDPVDATTAGRPARKRRQGRFVVLRPVNPGADAGPPFPDEATMRAWLDTLVPIEDPLFLTVLDRPSALPIGVVAFMNVDTEMRHLELGHIWYAPIAQRTRANTEVAYLMLRESFDELRHRRVEWKCDALNARSRAAAERLGFAFEGVFRQHMIVKGRNRDTAWFSMLDSEWPRVRANIERWLSVEPGTLSLSELNASG